MRGYNLLGAWALLLTMVSGDENGAETRGRILQGLTGTGTLLGNNDRSVDCCQSAPHIQYTPC